MKNENEFKLIVAKNLIKYRKANNLTQLELAEKLNYSDKAVSKWERGESLPDVYMLSVIANMYGITLNDLTGEETNEVKINSSLNKKIILALSVGLTWLVAMVFFVFLKIAGVSMAFLSFIYAIPAALIVTIVFAKLWNYKRLLFSSISLLYWTIPLTVCITVNWAHNVSYLFLIGIPLQILTILWFFRKK